MVKSKPTPIMAVTTSMKKIGTIDELAYTAAAATGASLLPQLTDGIRFLSAVVGLAAACVALYKAIKRK